MADWSTPTLSSTYTDFLQNLKDRDTDIALQFSSGTQTNIPTNAIKWDASANRWKKWNGSAWAELTSAYNFNNAQINSNQVLHAGNYNSYSPTLTGTGASGSWGISITGNAANITGTYAGTISSSQVTTGLGFTPLQQGGGAGQGSNKVYIGWSSSSLYLQVDSTNFAATWPIGISGNAATATNATYATTAGNGGVTSVNGQTGAVTVSSTATAGIFWENGQTVTSNYTITSGKNAMSAGPITIDTGITVTVPDNSVWTIV